MGYRLNISPTKFSTPVKKFHSIFYFPVQKCSPTEINPDSFPFDKLLFSNSYFFWSLIQPPRKKTRQFWFSFHSFLARRLMVYQFLFLLRHQRIAKRQKFIFFNVRLYQILFSRTKSWKKIYNLKNRWEDIIKKIIIIK